VSGQSPRTQELPDARKLNDLRAEFAGALGGKGGEGDRAEGALGELEVQDEVLAIRTVVEVRLHVRDFAGGRSGGVVVEKRADIIALHQF
jgi:hypothetical protein